MLSAGRPSYSSGVNWNCPEDGSPRTCTLAATSPPPPSALTPGTVARMSAWLLADRRCSSVAPMAVVDSGVAKPARSVLVPVTTTVCGVTASEVCAYAPVPRAASTAVVMTLSAWRRVG